MNAILQFLRELADPSPCDDLSDIARRARILLEEYEREGQRDAHEASRRAERMADPDRLL